ncbi:MAG: dienelactone hydrolase family-domain-containing protein [Monoraphidium minutum]|nr:MAG: dienelactone hydrolase family-domain-containing protein [Monoraphidium minutum]
MRPAVHPLTRQSHRGVCQITVMPRSGSLLLALALAASLALVVDARLTSEEVALWNTHTFGYLQSGTPTGKVVTFGAGAAAVKAYVATPPGGKPQAAVILFTDIFGWDLPNIRLWADRLAKAGFLAVVPDFFRGDKLTGQDFMGFLARQPEARVLKDFETVRAAVKKAYPGVKAFGQQGFCWGGYYTAKLSTPAEPRVAAAVGYHASLLAPADIDAITGPVMIQQADPALDTQINATFYAYIEKAFQAKRAKGGEAFITYYKDQPHGFALRGDGATPETLKAANNAFNAGLQFLKKRLLPPATAAATAAKAPKAAAAAVKPAGAAEFFGSPAAAAALGRASGAGAVAP